MSKFNELAEHLKQQGLPLSSQIAQNQADGEDLAASLAAAFVKLEAHVRGVDLDI